MARAKMGVRLEGVDSQKMRLWNLAVRLLAVATLATMTGFHSGVQHICSDGHAATIRDSAGGQRHHAHTLDGHQGRETDSAHLDANPFLASGHIGAVTRIITLLYRGHSTARP